MATSWRNLWRTPDADTFTLAIGRRADYEELTAPAGWHVLIAGLSNTGKSSTIRSLLYSAAPVADLAVLLVDVKRVESRPWRPRASEVAVTRAQAVTLLSDLLDEIHRRYELLEHLARVEWSTAHGPRILLVVDELAGVVATGEKTDRTVVSLLRQLLERGRAAGLTIVLATQRPSADVIPTSIRDLCALRIAHATANVESTRMVLADGADLGPAHLIPVDDAHRGRCWTITDGSRTPIEARAYWVTPEQAETQASRCAHLRAPWRSGPVDTIPTPTEPLDRAVVTVGAADVTARARSPWPAPVLPSEPSRPASTDWATAPTALTADDTEWLALLDTLLTGPLATDVQSPHREQPSEARAVARREAPQPATGPDPLENVPQHHPEVVAALTNAGRRGLTARQIADATGIDPAALRRILDAIATRAQNNRWTLQ